MLTYSTLPNSQQLAELDADWQYFLLTGRSQAAPDPPGGWIEVIPTMERYGLVRPLATAMPFQYQLARDATSLAIVRRISRESVHVLRSLIGYVDMLASSLHGKGIRIVGLGRLDMGSIRILRLLHARGIQVAAEPGDILSMVGRMHDVAQWSEACERSANVVDHTITHHESELAADLVNLCYGRVLDSALTIKGPIALNDARSIALAAVNCGAYRPALYLLEAAIKVSWDNCFKAHLHYICSLIYTKRLRDIESSDMHLALATRCVESSAGWQADVERGWIANGRALNLALSADGDMKSLIAALQLEMSALRGLSETADPMVAYLKYNVIANIVFLFEVMGAYDKALYYWDRCFGVLANHTLQAPFHYRAGSLQLKHGQYETAINHLTTARSSLSTEPWSGYRVALLLASGYLNTGALNHARETMLYGKQMAARALMTSEVGDIEQALQVLDGDQIPILRSYPKLPAYVPSLDLLDGPVSDLNQRLLDQHG